MNVVLISTYELGHQPFGLASPAAWLKQAGASVTCLDLAIERLADEPIASADLIAFYVPMHTATRIATAAVKRVQNINTNAHLCFYGLYAPMNESFLRRIGVDTILGGEFEEGLVALYESLLGNGGIGKHSFQHQPLVSLTRQRFLVPDRSGLRDLSRYAYLKTADGDRVVAGYTEASRGCKHLCRHCPVVPIYQGIFRVVQSEVVLEDIRRQVAAGASHITFGDPDFFNGIGHALNIVRALHQEHPQLTYDVTIKIEHLLKHSDHLRTLRETGCLFVTSAVESVDDVVLEILDKGHTRSDFIRAVSLFRENGLTLVPTFVTFHPWLSLNSYLDTLNLLDELDLVDYIPPIQLAIRLLIPAGSRLLELPTVQDLVTGFDEEALCYRWTHPDPRVDQLYEDVLDAVKLGESHKESRRTVFRKVWQIAHDACGIENRKFSALGTVWPTVRVPCMSEPWFC